MYLFLVSNVALDLETVHRKDIVEIWIEKKYTAGNRGHALLASLSYYKPQARINIVLEEEDRVDFYIKTEYPDDILVYLTGNFYKRNPSKFVKVFD